MKLKFTFSILYYSSYIQKFGLNDERKDVGISLNQFITSCLNDKDISHALMVITGDG